jgi:hypothetical protein
MPILLYYLPFASVSSLAPVMSFSASSEHLDLDFDIYYLIVTPKLQLSVNVRNGNSTL